MRMLYSPKALSVPEAELLRTTRDLDSQMRQWWARLPAPFKRRPSSKLFRDNPNLDPTQWSYINFAYHGTLCAIHNVITYPWVQSRFDLAQNQSLIQQVEESSRAVADASRALASITQHTEVHAGSHVWYDDPIFPLLPKPTLCEHRAYHLTLAL